LIYPAVYNFTIEQRAGFDRSFAISDEDGEPLDFTGYTIRASLWTPRRVKLLDFTLTWVSHTLGEFTLTLTPEETAALSGTAVWDLLVIDPDEAEDYYLRGEVLIEPGFTV
jgi:hypothetical protein